MAMTRESDPVADLVAVTVGPVLVMLMVGSLVFFLIEVLYAGNYPGRLLYTMFFFVLGAVLIARIAIREGRAYAGLYAAGLGGACFVAMMTYVEYPKGPMRSLGPVLNVALMALVWWSAHKLTWDCTHLDENRKASGRGVLAAAGLDDGSRGTGQPTEEDEPEPKEVKKSRKPAPGFVGWVERWRDYREAQTKKPHTPGVWVLYFALAAIPLFALGQSLINSDDAERRRATFLQMAVYVGSALGLLVTTSLLGLRKYLEERSARVPAVMTYGWLGLGAGLIVLFLAVGALLPRPHSETPWFGMSRAGSSDRDASQYAVVRDANAGKGDGAAGQKTEAGDGKNSAKGGKEGGNKGEKGSGGGKGDQGSGGQQDGGKNGNSQGKQSGNSKDQGNDAKSGAEKSKDRKDAGGKNATQGEKGQSSSGSTSEKSNDANDGGESRDADDGDSGGSEESSSGPSQIGQMLESIGGFIKWVVWILVAIAVIVGVVLFVLKGLAPFTNWAKNLLDWLRGLFARPPKEPSGPTGADEADTSESDRPPPFASFDNPFNDGTAKRRDPAELVAYTFAALDAWAWERDLGREPGETPLEFAARLGHEFERLDEPAYRAANLYVRVLYSRSSLPADTLPTLEALWDQMEAAPARRNVRAALIPDDPA